MIGLVLFLAALLFLFGGYSVAFTLPLPVYQYLLVYLLWV